MVGSGKKSPSKLLPRSVSISLEQARTLAVSAQMLTGTTDLPSDKEGVARTIEHLGYTQIDTIAVVERAHHHTLWSRLPAYNPAWLHELQAKDRRIFEYWGHAASYLPFADFRYYLPLMKQFPGRNAWFQQWHDTYGHLLQEIFSRIEREGALSSADFKTPDHGRRGPWWDWKPAKAALEILFWQGRLLISGRRNFQRLYDLAERVIPSSVDQDEPQAEEVGRFFVRRALTAHGLVREKDIFGHLPVTSKKNMQQGLKNLLEAGDAVPVLIEHGPEQYFALDQTMTRLAQNELASDRVCLLSPFDNLVIMRDRVLKLFGFDYRLECYTPPKKRIFGYFSLPILWGNRLIGRLDPKAERKEQTLTVKMLAFEADFKEHRRLYPLLARTLVAYGRFNNCPRIKLEQTRNAPFLKQLQQHLGKASQAE